MARCRLLVVSIAPDGGGAERFACTLLTHLDRALFEPSVCFLRDASHAKLPADVPVGELGKHRAFDLPSAVWRLRTVIRVRRPDVVLSTVSSTGLVVAAALATLPRPPRWVRRVGDNPLLNADERGWRRLHAALLGRADRCICNAHGLVEAVLAAYPSDWSRIGVAWNPTDFDAIDRLAVEDPDVVLPNGPPTVLYVGRLAPQKRLDVLLSACASLRARHPARLVLCGDGPLAPWVEAEATRLGIARDVVLLGHRPNPYPYIRGARVVALSSDHEGLPNALIEAQGLAVPVVSTRAEHGPEEIVEHGSTGLLTPAGDAEALADAMAALFADPGLRERMGARARERARKRFGLDATMGRWQEILRGAPGAREEAVRRW